MTYCVALRLNQGLLFMSDTRTNAGVDNISTYRKLHNWSSPGKASVTLLTAGNLATTQAVVSLLDERTKATDDRDPSILAVPSMFQVARLVAETLREVIAEQSGISGPVADSAMRGRGPSTFSGANVFGMSVCW